MRFIRNAKKEEKKSHMDKALISQRAEILQLNSARTKRQHYNMIIDHMNK
jgi:hypothetical protein